MVMSSMTAGNVHHYIALVLFTSARLSGAEFVVSPAGTPRGNGTERAPWSVSRALGATGPVRPGDTIWLRKGTYVGQFVSTLTGTPNAPIIVRISRRACDDRRQLQSRRARELRPDSYDQRSVYVVLGSRDHELPAGSHEPDRRVESSGLSGRWRRRFRSRHEGHQLHHP